MTRARDKGLYTTPACGASLIQPVATEAILVAVSSSGHSKWCILVLAAVVRCLVGALDGLVTYLGFGLRWRGATCLQWVVPRYFLPWVREALL